MKKLKMNYESPVVTLEEIEAEAGIAISNFGNPGQAAGEIIIDEEDLGW